MWSEHTINGIQEAGTRIQVQPVGLQHPGLASGRRGEDLEGDGAVAAVVADVVAVAVVVALACETLARCRSRHDRQNHRGRHVLRLLGHVG